MAKMAGESEDLQESAVKWLSLAILHGINSHAEKIAIFRDEEGGVRVRAEYHTAELPPPSDKIAQAVIAAVRDITHIEDKGKLPLSVGIRDSSIDLEVKLKSKHGKEKLKLKFK